MLSEPGGMRDAISAGVAAYVVAGLHAQRVKPVLEVAPGRIEREQALRVELRDAKEALADRKMIDRAKGILIKAKACGQAEAFALLRNQAMNERHRSVHIALRYCIRSELVRGFQPARVWSL